MFGEKILNYWDDIVADLKEMVAIPSVSINGNDEYPFGEDAAKAIDLAMELSKKYGLDAKNVDYYAMHAQYGEGDENAIVMAHLDVVPAGEGWDGEPYTMTERDGKFFGRGVGDNKGPAIVALHCLRALKDAGIEPKRKLRVVLGSSEETGMTDMPYYFSKEQHPDMGFTPDAAYGICFCEKGHYVFEANGKNDSSVIKSFKSGTVANAVPFKAEATLECTDMEFEKLIDMAEKAEGDFTITKTNTGADILSMGTAGHAAMPETAFNAASYLVKLLYDVFGSEKLGKFFSFINDKIATSFDGEPIGVKMSDDSGELTFNLGIVSSDEDSSSLKVDIRYPASKKGDELTAIIKSATDSYGLEFVLLDDTEPLYVAKDSKLIKILSSAYEDVTGKECDMFSMGGGTYARQMFNKGVAFGSSFPENPDGGAHTANEFIQIENLKLHAQICLEAMYRMLTAE